MEAAVRVKAMLRAGIGCRALVYVHARLPIIFQMEAGVAPALRGGKSTRAGKATVRVD